ncbi:cation diffusion facilitator family transporter [Halpernia frigidisoli]|uniref:Cation diffusion facilitator family transporter n=1 Tax=Halpernia frigidisoli TaxID=1125876 RepID=A0A1I3HK18_9FLAO|nr:cation diffusion facilitator family transporter [Halpernia frigidisoli]SFI35927.1 cation diffusion facilitator family transporter [Halpernia frigidisoli]
MDKTKEISKNNFAFQRNVAIIGVVLFIGKLIAWRLTNSDAIFSEAMESIVNIVAAFLGLYSLYLASKPRDEDHPYGHGKVEFITSGIEGALIIFAGFMIIGQAIASLLNKNTLDKVDFGIYIIAATAIVNYLIGYISLEKGKKENSFVLQSSGKHLMADTITTVGVIASLIVVYITKIFWIDAVVALLFGGYIISVGYKIARKSLSGIMDAADPEMLQKLSSFLNGNRKKTWIDVHNMKIQQHGSRLHIDAHLTLPWYFELRDAHNEMEELVVLIAKNSDRKIEFNFHMDDCKEFSCKICQIENCPVRQHAFEKLVIWDEKNISQIQKHFVEN